MTKYKNLIVDDEWNIRHLVKIYLTKENFQVDEARDFYEAIKVDRKRSYESLVLNIMLPGIYGKSFGKQDYPITSSRQFGP